MTSRLRAGLIALLSLSVNCLPAQQTAHPEIAKTEVVTFDLEREKLFQNGASQELIAKLENSRFRYFRMLAEPFEVRVCKAFGHRSTALPITALHGDAHLEQFVATANTYGMEDFDRAGFGPAVVDLVRYASSIHIACKDVDWPCDPAAAVARFLDTWRAALDKEPARAGVPAVVERLRGKAPKSRDQWLSWADHLMVPIAGDVEADRPWLEPAFGGRLTVNR